MWISVVNKSNEFHTEEINTIVFSFYCQCERCFTLNNDGAELAL